MSQDLRLRTGFEVELLAPAGCSRQVLAQELARSCGGRVRPVWHSDSEPSLVPGLGHFLHLTQGFEVDRPDGRLLCALVDDVTLVADLDPRSAAVPGWHRLLTDDGRLLRLLARHSDPGGTLDAALDGVAALWGAQVERHAPVARLQAAGSTVALAAPQGGGRERACEIVTPPLVSDHAVALEELLAPARALGFSVPREAAVHLHLDGAPFREPQALASVVRLFAHERDELHTALGTNPHCRRLGPLPAELVRAADQCADWAQLEAAARQGGLSKYCDVNLTQLFADRPVRDTLEVRILPGALHADDVVAGAHLVEGLLQRCLDPAQPPGAGGVLSASLRSR